MKILIIGGGSMGMTYAKSFLSSHIVKSDGMMILEKSEEKAIELQKQNIGTLYSNPGEFIKNADLIILAVKPQDIQALFDSLKGYLDSQQVILSIMAGVKMQTICNSLAVTKVIRAMPNLATQIGKSMTVFTSTNDVTRIELVMVQNLINTTGKSIYTNDESMIDAATAISGSGPAYVLYFMDSLIKTAIEMGFSPSEAELLVAQTFRGTTDLFRQSNLPAKDWINKVASKGGTTEAAIKSFDENKLNEKIEIGAKAALERAIELGENKTDFSK